MNIVAYFMASVVMLLRFVGQKLPLPVEMPSLVSFALLGLLCINGAIADRVTLFVQNELTTFQTEPQSKTVKYGSSVLLSCNSSIAPTGYPLYPILMIKWHKDGSAINFDKKRIVVQQRGGHSTLEIKSVTHSDAGFYQCSVLDGPSYEDSMPCPSLLTDPASYTYITLTAPTYLYVISNTAVITPPVAIIAAQNEPLLLECDSHAAQGPDVAEWSFNGMNITKEICKGCILLMNHKLLIQQITKESAGNYSCIATWLGYYTKETVYLVTVNNDTYNGPEVITLDRSTMAINGSNYKLECYTSPHVNTSILWLRNGTVISQDHSLSLEMIFPCSDGLYSCALNQDLLQYESVDISVLVPPVIYLGGINKTIYIQKNEAKLLYCQASGNPHPTSLWYKNGKPLNNQTLIISYENYGIFQCFANNTAGVTYETIRVLRYGVPNPPQDLQCMPKVLSYTIFGQAILSWKKPAYTGYPTVPTSENIIYSVTVCTNGHVELQEKTIATVYKTIMRNDYSTYFYYLSISVNGISSGKTLCRVFPPDRFSEPRSFETLNCSGNSALATWNVDPYNPFIALNSVIIWGFCLNGTKQMAFQNFNASDLGQKTIDLPILDMGVEFICFFEGNYAGVFNGYRRWLKIPTETCNQHKDHPAPKNISADSIVAIACNGNHVTLSWTIACLDERDDIAITGICSNYSLHQMFEETLTGSNGTVVFDVNMNASGCFFQFNISRHLEEISSGTLLCSFLDIDNTNADQYNLRMCNPGQTHLIVNPTNKDITLISKEVPSISSTAPQSSIIITIASAVIIIMITGIVASTIVILFRKMLCIRTTDEDRVFNELFPSTAIKEKEIFQTITNDGSMSNITIIEHLTFPFIGAHPLSIAKSVSYEGPSLEELSSIVTTKIESSDQSRSNVLPPEEAFDEVLHTHIGVHKGLNHGLSHDNSSGSSDAAMSSNSSSGIE